MSESTATLTPSADPSVETPVATVEANATPNPAANGTAPSDPGAQQTPGDAAAAAAVAPSPVDEAIGAARKADLARLAERYGLEGEFDSVDDLETALNTQERAAKEASHDAESKTFYRETARKLDADLAAITFDAHDEDGNPVTYKLTPEQRQAAVFNHLGDFRVRVREYEQQENLNELADVAEAIIPGDNLEGFAKAVEGKDLPLEKWLPEVVEAAAAGSKYVKTLSLEAALKVSPKLAAEHAAALAASRASGWKEGNGAPGGQPTADNVAAGNNSKLTRQAFEHMTKDEQANAWKTRPDEVRAL